MERRRCRHLSGGEWNNLLSFDLNEVQDDVDGSGDGGGDGGSSGGEDSGGDSLWDKLLMEFQVYSAGSLTWSLLLL